MRMSTMHVAEPVTDTALDQLCVNTIRTLSIDAVQQARSGHPGTPMALAPLMYIATDRDRVLLTPGASVRCQERAFSGKLGRQMRVEKHANPRVTVRPAAMA